MFDASVNSLWLDPLFCYSFCSILRLRFQFMDFLFFKLYLRLNASSFGVCLFLLLWFLIEMKRSRDDVYSQPKRPIVSSRGEP